MDNLIYIYMITITMELILSILLGVILLAVLAPLGSGREVDEDDNENASIPDPGRHLSPEVSVALRDAFDSLSRGGRDVAPLVHARQLLVKYQAGWMDEDGPPAQR